MRQLGIGERGQGIGESGQRPKGEEGLPPPCPKACNDDS